MKIFLLCILATILLLYLLAVINGYPLLRKYQFTGFSLESRVNPFLEDFDGNQPIRLQGMGVYFSIEETRKVTWIIPGIYDHEQYGSPYKLDIHLNSETIQQVTNVRFELSSADGQRVTYIPDDGKLTLETGPHLTVFSRHFDPLESATDLNWEAINKLTLNLEFVAPLNGVETPIKISHTYEKKSSPVRTGNPLYTDIFLSR